MGSEGADGRVNRQQFNAMVAQYGEIGMGDLYGESLKWSGGAHCNLPSLVFNGGCKQNGVPNPDSPLVVYDHIGVYQVNSSQDYIHLPNLRGIGSYRDEWDYVTGKGLRYIHKVELDGESEHGKVISTKYNDTVRAAIYYPEFSLFPKSGIGYNLSTHFVNKKWAVEIGNMYQTQPDRIYLGFDNILFPTTQSINDWLKAQKEAGTPVTIYYVMAEPIPFEERPQPYVPIPNDSGKISFVDGPLHNALPPFELTYITHS